MNVKEFNTALFKSVSISLATDVNSGNSIEGNGMSGNGESNMDMLCLDIQELL